ncbi:ankyrin repeat domain-containing protein [Streptomyces sp. SID13666]|uniref:ankyrin repeat domain-containing protein n=1 Tax=unclassified Streptomyces TaxID=2593676 RepID=UPI0013C0FF26|nr:MULTISPECIES: ankyrin repeat domain-containing protein [unclassified Streptomyces]NEA60384.1 ankyrin repeat domain-containing protein [Streptomyces sp. SID13666]NEA76754.1 ankyrin repeat domain-containing protein [Streptomyces sp. SID13588]
MDVADQLVRSADAGDVISVARQLELGAAVDAPDTGGRTALDVAAGRGHADVVRLLIDAGADLEQRAGEYEESTPLCLAAIRGHTAVVGALLDAGARTGAQGRMGYVPLVLAATAGNEGYPETVDLLLDHGADVNAVMKRKTALDWATGFGQIPMVRHLLSRGATPSAKALTNAREHTDRDPECRQKTGRIAAVPLGAGATAGAEQVVRHLPEQDDPGTEAKNQA